MNRRNVAPSHLPSLIMPCPSCGRRMHVKSVEPTRLAADLEEVTHACAPCGTELIRTVRPHRGHEAA